MVTTTRQQVSGLRELGEAMRALGDDMGLKIARAATGAAAQPIKRRAMEIVRANSVDTGTLLSAVIVKRLPKSESRLTSEHMITVRGRGKVSKKTGKRQSEAPYASKLEFGTVHIAAEPFLRPAFEQEKGTALAKIVDRLKARIDKANRSKP